jgi:hypothetical protein
MIFIILVFIISIFSFAEILVFNEEVLLALDFVLFIYFVYSISNESIADDFKIQSNKLISDLLQALDNKMHEEMHLYEYSKDVMQFTNQIKLLHIMFVKDLVLLPEARYLLLTEQTSYMFLHEITDKVKTIRSKEVAVQGIIVERYIFSGLFLETPSISLIDSNIRNMIPLCDNLITFTEIHSVN